jgi:hypothetical protein
VGLERGRVSISLCGISHAIDQLGQRESRHSQQDFRLHCLRELLAAVRIWRLLNERQQPRTRSFQVKDSSSGE